ncbi:MAG TPA: gluconate 2-dehydrogenase subunit 3 family protein [Gemmatimonadaceae bacterium]
MSLSRRMFVNWLGRCAAAVGLAPSLNAQRTASQRAEPQEPSPSSLDPEATQRLAEAVLPSEIGSDGAARVARGFRDWIAGYREGAELVHPYGSATIRYTGPSPLSRWRTQLAALDRDARTSHGRAFSALTVEERRALVRRALAGSRAQRLSDPLDAEHVALALMSWYFRSPEAADLCYRARIGRHQCRPLVNAPREPLPLAPPGSGR